MCHTAAHNATFAPNDSKTMCHPLVLAWLLSYVHRAVMQMDAKGNGTVAKASGGQRWEDDALRAFYQAYHSLGAKWAEVSML